MGNEGNLILGRPNQKSTRVPEEVSHTSDLAGLFPCIIKSKICTLWTLHFRGIQQRAQNPATVSSPRASFQEAAIDHNSHPLVVKKYLDSVARSVSVSFSNLVGINKEIKPTASRAELCERSSNAGLLDQLVRHINIEKHLKPELFRYEKKSNK